jgi:hypothetical protein
MEKLNDRISKTSEMWKLIPTWFVKLWW